MERLLPKYRIVVLNDEGEWTPATWPDGDPRFRVGRDPERVIRFAIAEMLDCADDEPHRHFAVLGSEGEVVKEFRPDPAASPVPF